MSELNREQIIKALKDMNIIGVSPVAIRNAIVLIKELTEENERLRAELEQRPPRLVITKLQKGNNDENSKDTVALQEREADHHI